MGSSQGRGHQPPPPPGTALLVGRTHLLRLGGSLRGQRSPLPGLWFPSQLEPPKTGGGSGGCWLLGRMAFEPVSRQPLPGLCLLPGHPVLGHPTDPPPPPGHTPPFRPRSGPSFRAISPHTGAGPVQFHPFPHQCCHRKGRVPGRRDFWVSTQYFLVRVSPKCHTGYSIKHICSLKVPLTWTAKSGLSPPSPLPKLNQLEVTPWRHFILEIPTR